MNARLVPENAVRLETDDELDNDDGSLVSTLALTSPALTTNTSLITTYSDDDHDHDTDNFTSGGTASPVNDDAYNDDDRSKGEPAIPARGRRHPR